MLRPGVFFTLLEIFNTTRSMEQYTNILAQCNAMCALCSASLLGKNKRNVSWRQGWFLGQKGGVFTNKFTFIVWKGGTQKGGTSAIIAAPSSRLLLLLLGCSTWLLQNQSKGELTFLKNMSTSQTGHWCWVVCQTTSVCFIETLYFRKQWSCPKHLKSKHLHRRF